MSYTDLAGTSPYFDDFNSNLNFLRLLSVPGRAIQARELTQAQTILQNQISHLSSHILANNSLVYGGQIEFNSNKPAVKLEPTYVDDQGVTTGVNIDPNSLIGNVYDNSTTSSRLTITHARIINNELFAYYSFTGENFISDEICTPFSGTTSYIKFDGAPFTSTSAKCNAGIIYRDGHFIAITEQEKIIANTNTGKLSAGYRLIESNV